MPPFGKPVANPFTAAVSESGSATARPSASMPQTPVPPVSRLPKGVSRLASEDHQTRLSMRKATVWSAILHVVSPITLALLTLLVILVLSWILHFNFWDLFKAPEQPRDLEFTLVQDTHAPRPEKPKFKGNNNQKAGGKTNPKQPLKAVQEPNAAPPAKQATQPKPQKTETPPKPVANPTPPQPQPAAQKPQPQPQPSQKQAIALPQPTASPSQSDEMADTPANDSSAAAQSGPASISMGDAAMGTNGPAGSNLSNAQGGDGPAGVDVAQDIDFGPFMAELEKRIKRNWTPPRGAESQKVLLLFYLARDGRLLKVETKRSSGDAEADRAAIAAVQASAPFTAFPPQVKEDVLPVEFTFDYNVLNPKNAKQALKW